MMTVFELEEVISDDKEIHIDVNKHLSTRSLKLGYVSQKHR